MEGVVIGQYVPGNSFLHALDPRTKLISSALLFWLIFLLKTPGEYVGFGLFLIILYFLAGVAGSFLRILKPGLYLIIFTVGLNAFFTPGHILINLGIAFITREGLVQGLTMGFRLLFLISVSSLVTLTTSPVRMTDGLELMMKPLKKVKVPVSELAMMMSIALRFIPTFWEETDTIKKAQVSRGADFESWHPAQRVKYITALLVPLFISAFRKADELSVAMEARGYFVGMERTCLYKLEMGWHDYIVLLLMGAVFIAINFYKYL